MLDRLTPRLRHGLAWCSLGITSLLASCILLVVAADILISNAHIYTYQDVNLIPYNKVAVVLGTSKYQSDGRRNLYFQNRMF